MSRSVDNRHSSLSALEEQLANKNQLRDAIKGQLSWFPPGNEPPEKVIQLKQLEQDITDLEAEIDALPAEETARQETPTAPSKQAKRPPEPILGGRFHVDRTDELALLARILAPQARQRILLLQAPPGFGKSLLLDQYEDRLLEEKILYARVDLSAPGFGVLDFLRYLCDEWGRTDFGRCVSAMEQFVVGGGPTERKERIEKLTEVWFQDCKAWLESKSQAVIIVDAYNVEAAGERTATVDPELCAWLEATFLLQVRRTPGLRLVLAGQQVPPPHGAWEHHCCRHTLEPISDPGDWMEWVRAVGWRISHEVVSAFCHSTRGHPLQMAMMLQGLAGWEGPR